MPDPRLPRGAIARLAFVAAFALGCGALIVVGLADSQRPAPPALAAAAPPACQETAAEIATLQAQLASLQSDAESPAPAPTATT